jgi:hypothetical protein
VLAAEDGGEDSCDDEGAEAWGSESREIPEGSGSAEEGGNGVPFIFGQS